MKFTVDLWGEEAVDVEVIGNEDGTITAAIDGTELAPRIVEWAIRYGFRQGIRDAAAAEPEDAKRNVLARKRIDALVNNTLREGFGGGAKLSLQEREARSIAEREMREAFGKPENDGWVKEQMKAHGLNRSELLQAAIKSHLADNKDRLMAEAQEALSKQTPVTALPSIKVA